MRDVSELNPRIFGPLATVRPDRDEQSFVRSLRAREQAAWTTLFEETHGIIFRAALSQVGDRELAQDITAQVYLEAIEGIGRYRDRGRPFVAWLLTIARHRSIDAVRRQRRDDAAAIQPPSEPIACATEAIELLARLTPEQREVVHLRFVEDQSIEEVAALTGRSTNAVKSLQHRALAQLRAYLTLQRMEARS